VSDSICHTVWAHGKTESNQVYVFVENVLAIRLTKPGDVSDSWTYRAIPTKRAAKTTGSATCHHLQKTISIRYVVR